MVGGVWVEWLAALLVWLPFSRAASPLCVCRLMYAHVGVDILGTLFFAPSPPCPPPIRTTITPSYSLLPPKACFPPLSVFRELTELKGEAQERVEERWRRGWGRGRKREQDYRRYSFSSNMSKRFYVSKSQGDFLSPFFMIAAENNYPWSLSCRCRTAIERFWSFVTRALTQKKKKHVPGSSALIFQMNISMLY